MTEKSLILYYDDAIYTLHMQLPRQPNLISLIALLYSNDNFTPFSIHPTRQIFDGSLNRNFN